jgi:hypothetical protein
MAKIKKIKNVSKKDPLVDKTKLIRKHAIVTTFNDIENDAFDRYCKQYKVKNKSKVIREMILSSIWKDFNQNYPTLFDKQELADLVIERR